ncbi:MAG: nitroreductase family deazaflavin-dependent oxidoreductase [Actinomycetota bacterium]|nr:nitroreductase family deazaflavin-dependent oxidoreductase [Actinomycetota bacterium]
MKRRLVHLFQRYLANPPVRLLFALGALPPGYGILETTGRRTGRPRQVPVGAGRVGNSVWIVVEHGHRAGYVRNLEADPHVRMKLRTGLGTRWRTGTAHVLPDDDPRARQRWLARGRPAVWLNALTVRVLGTDLLTVRIDLD